MKKAYLVIFSAFLSISWIAVAQNNNPLFPEPPRAGGTGASSPANDRDLDDANGSFQSKAAAEGENRRPEKKRNFDSSSASRADEKLGSDTTTLAATAPIPPRSERLNSTALVDQIRVLPFESRNDFLSRLVVRLESSERDVLAVKANSTGFSGRARDALNDAYADYKKTQKTLRHSLDAAQRAGGNDWGSARSALARDYEAYSIALARLEASAAIDR